MSTANVHSGQTGQNDEFVDAAFETLVRDVDERINVAESAIRSGSDSTIRDALDELCRSIRTARLDFRTIVKYYGSSYECQAQHFVESVIHAADLAQHTDSEVVRESFARHAEFVQQAQIEMKSAE